jgi:hypothetical protein
MDCCPKCKNRVGFAFGTCIQCGYNHLDEEYTRIEVDMEVLERYVPPYILSHLIERHERKYKDLYKH